MAEEKECWLDEWMNRWFVGEIGLMLGKPDCLGGDWAGREGGGEVKGVVI